MSTNSRFPLPEKTESDNSPMSSNRNTRFYESERQNPFKSLRSRQSANGPPLSINSRAEALKNDEGDYNNPFQRQKREYNTNSRFSDPDRRNNFRRNHGNFNRNHRNSNRAGYSDRRTSYFQQYSKKKKDWCLDAKDFPALVGESTKKKDPIIKQENILDFKDAAKKGERCTTPPPRPALPPHARLSRPQKKDSDDESLGWNTDDEKAAREADPSDDEDEDLQEKDTGFWD